MDNRVPQFVAHVSDDGDRYESVFTHLSEVAQMASEFAADFEAGDWAYAAGMLHDIGKYAADFQDRILRGGPRVDHSTAGAYEAAKNCSMLLSYCVAGHHGGLPDAGSQTDPGTTLYGRLAKAKKGLIPSYDAFSEEVAMPCKLGLPHVVDLQRLERDPSYAIEAKFAMTFFTRMVFSCLVDADYLCTERFMHGSGRPVPHDTTLESMREDLELKLSEFYPPQTKLNAIRCQVLDDCKRAASMQPGLFSLTVPTGGGKTYALMRFALHHATHPGHKFRRVIVAEPYTSIIEQNAEVYRRVFGNGAVLEHHSNYDFGNRGELSNGAYSPLRLATENWDVPLVVTTNVQLFESLYASKTSRCRKLHNVARSIIVLDEAQMIPTQFLEPCVKALCELVKHYGCTVVLCTATQPTLNQLFSQEGLSVQEIAASPRELVEELRRVTYKSLGSLEDNELARSIAAHRQALCIVNSRKQARALYDLVTDLYPCKSAVYYLTTLMYPAHRSDVIRQIKSKVQAGERCIVIATSLVEAGVDLDFATVYRAVAGIDSIVQAAGRCNREMRRSAEESTVNLFVPKTPYSIPAEVKQRGQVALGVDPCIALLGASPCVDSLDVVTQFFWELYAFRSLDDKQIVARLSKGEPYDFPFEAVSNDFRLVEDATIIVIIPTEDNRQDIEALSRREATRATMRMLAHFGVGVYPTDRDALLRAGAITMVGENVCLLLDTARYKDDIGLDLNISTGEAVFL